MAHSQILKFKILLFLIALTKVTFLPAQNLVQNHDFNNNGGSFSGWTKTDATILEQDGDDHIAFLSGKNGVLYQKITGIEYGKIYQFDIDFTAVQIEQTTGYGYAFGGSTPIVFPEFTKGSSDLNGVCSNNDGLWVQLSGDITTEDTLSNTIIIPEGVTAIYLCLGTKGATSKMRVRSVTFRPIQSETVQVNYAVYDSSGANPIEDAVIQVDGIAQDFVTDSSGKASFSLAPSEKPYYISISKPWYQTTNDTIMVDGSLNSFSVAMDSLLLPVVEVWDNENIGKKEITQPGIYQVKGVVEGMIDVKGPYAGVVIEGVGENPVFKDIPEEWNTSIFTSTSGTPTMLRNFTFKYYYNGQNVQGDFHKATWLKAPSCLISNCRIFSYGKRSVVAGQVSVGTNGVIEDSYCRIIDDGYKVNSPGALVRNSTVEMIGNGSAITLDYGGSSGEGHYAENCLIKGASGHHPPAGNMSSKAQDAALGAVTEYAPTKVYYNNITILNGKNFAHIMKVMEETDTIYQDIRITGTITGGVKTSVNSNTGTIWSPVVINALQGEIKDVYIDFGGALSDPKEHFVNGKLTNIWIDGVYYNGTYNQQFGNEVQATGKRPEYIFIHYAPNGKKLTVSGDFLQTVAPTDSSEEAAWEVQYIDDYFYLLHQGSRKYLTVENGQPALSTIKSDNSKWRWVDALKTNLRMENVESGEWLDNKEGNFQLSPVDSTKETTKWYIKSVPVKYAESHYSLQTSASTIQRQILKIYPQPASNALFVDGLQNEEAYGVFSITGQEVLSGKTLHKIDISALQAGIYFLKFENRASVKFIKTE